MGILSRAKHFGERIIREVREYPSRFKEYGFKVASVTFVDGLIPPEKHSFYIRTIEEYVDGFMKPIVDKYRNWTIDVDHRSGEEKVPVWCCWWQGFEQMPELVRMCNCRLRKFLPEEADLHMITQQNYRNYVDIPDYIIQKFESGKMSITALSDVIRVSLLAKYGGFWIDSTVFISDQFPVEFIRNDYYAQRMYDEVKWKHEACKGRWCGFLMGGKPGNIIFLLLRDAFYDWWKEHDSVIDYVILDYFLLAGYKQIPAIQNQIDSVPNNNMDVFEMYKVLNEPYTSELYAKLTSSTNLHKLTYKMELAECTFDGSQTLYGYIKQSIMEK